MKKILFTICAVATATTFLVSCSGNAQQNNAEKADSTAAPAQQQTTAPAEAKPAADSAAALDLTKKFICPNRCESADQEGACSVCGMDLVPNE
ncbi:MAG: hypothetical protein IKQ46_13665 [Bacteroidales bacterium]|jgi:hypothetical protein|nr:hypothetical protein [Bacteroidales bacterium]